jgi:hypothetical protein
MEINTNADLEKGAEDVTELLNFFDCGLFARLRCN